jgi:hypothetical protein
MDMKTRRQQLLSITKRHESMVAAEFMNILQKPITYLQVHWFVQTQVKPIELRGIVRKEFDIITGKSNDYFA